MKNAQEIINALRDEFCREAKNAPKLFIDLSKVEQYIAESYKLRSFIELIQNADDAGSSKFGLYSFDDALVAANNGRIFTIDDVEALCRSGSSNKSRGGNTIGYRGIGFKSVVNIAESIYVFSGDFSFYFDKNETIKILPDIPTVPLIRVPHPYMNSKNNKLLEAANTIKNEYQYTTLFLFCGLNKRIAHQEILEFDKNSLLFLNNIRQVHFQIDNVIRNITVDNKLINNQLIIKIAEGEHLDEWEVLRSINDPRDMIAFKRQDNHIVPALPDESIIHSFTPTSEFSGAYLKINGDYSTDPSRKNIDMDDISQKSFSNAISIIIEMIKGILERRIVKKGFFSPFVNVKEGNKIKQLLLKSIADSLSDSILNNFNGKEINFSSIRIRPDWLNYEDYENLCGFDCSFISKELVTIYPELPSFLEQMNVKKINLEEILNSLNEAQLSIIGSAQIIAKLINQYRYDFTSERVNQVKKLRIFPLENVFVTVNKVTSVYDLNKDFLKYLSDNVDASDLRLFFRKLDIEIDTSKMTRVESNNNSNTSTSDDIYKAQDADKTLKVLPNIQKWRSAEKNAEEYIKSLDGVLSVSNVSNANMGYDLEILLINGKKIYVEVKSVSSFSEPIKITNNEYSSAHSYGTSYFLAVVINDDPFQIRFITDPINTLEFEKQIERWSWFCESYKANFRNTNDLFQ